MKKIVALLFWIITAISVGQSSSDILTESFKLIKSYDSVYLSLNGTDNFNGSITSLRSDTYWQFTSSSNGFRVVKMENTDYSNGKINYRVVGDGKNIWLYALDRNEYSYYSYGMWKADPQPGGYVESMSWSFTWYSWGATSYCSRLLEDIYLRGYRCWVVPVNDFIIDNGRFIYDPLSGRLFQSNRNTFYISYWHGIPVNKTVTYEIEVTNNGNVLRAVYFAEKSKIQNCDRLTNWKIDIFTKFTGGNYQFVPPVGARAIPGRRGVG